MGITRAIFAAILLADQSLNAMLGMLGVDLGHRFRVVLYGSARLQEGSPSYLKIFWFAAKLIKMGIDVVTGGGPGAMEAGNRGAIYQKWITFSHARSTGVSLVLPFEQRTNGSVENDFPTENFSLRLRVFGVLACCHVITDKGGIGTLLEAIKFIQLHQIQKYQGMQNANPCLFPLHPSVQLGYVPWIIVIGPLYDKFFELLKDMEEEGTLNMSELTFLKKAENYEHAMALVKKARKKWRKFLKNRDVDPLN